MTLRLRPGTVADAEQCGRIQYEAFRSIAEQHNFTPDFPSVEAARDVVRMLLSHPRFYSVVAELDGRIVGCNFLDERSTIAGVGPVSVDPPVMDGTIGRQLMQAVMDRARERRSPGVRLLQIAWHYRSLALYTKLGFEIHETISGLQGPSLHSLATRFALPGRRTYRPAISSVSAFTGTTGRENWPMPSATEAQTWSPVWAGSQATRRPSAGFIMPWARRTMT